MAPADALRRGRAAAILASAAAGGGGAEVGNSLAVLGFMLVAVACADPQPQGGAPVICRDKLSGKCYPCPGSIVCVDPVACVVSKCSDVSLFPHDAGAATPTDAQGSDAPDSSAAEVKDAGPEVVDAADVADIPNIKDIPDTGCPDPCPAIGLVECLNGVPATRSCQLGADKCLSWTTPIACPVGQVCELGQCKSPPVVCNPACGAGQTCQNGLCIATPCSPPCAAGQSCQAGTCITPTTGSLTCAQIAGCIGNCPIEDDTCPAGCKDKGTGDAQKTFATFQTCIQSTCKAIAQQGKQNEALFCIYQYCGKEQAACLGAGSGTCNQLNDCLNGCSGSQICVTSCNAAASQQAGLDFYGLMTCVDANCASFADKTACAEQQCSAQFGKCFSGGNSGGTLPTCAAILACAGGCKDKACAQACKAAGTAQAQAVLQALLDCQTMKCSGWCVTGNEPQCGQCMAQFCGSQQSACGM